MGARLADGRAASARAATAVRLSTIFAAAIRLQERMDESASITSMTE